jgi:hypothetical protein
MIDWFLGYILEERGAMWTATPGTDNKVYRSATKYPYIIKNHHWMFRMWNWLRTANEATRLNLDACYLVVNVRIQVVIAFSCFYNLMKDRRGSLSFLQAPKWLSVLLVLLNLFHSVEYEKISTNGEQVSACTKSILVCFQVFQRY